MAASIDDRVFWHSTPAELRLLLDATAERDERDERRATLRAGLITSAVLNVHRARGQPAVLPSDFLAKKTTVISTESMRDALVEWARAHNAAQRAKGIVQ